MRRLETSAYVRDLNGQIWQAALPPVYGELQADNQKLTLERQQQFTEMDKLREQARGEPEPAGAKIFRHPAIDGRNARAGARPVGGADDRTGRVIGSQSRRVKKKKPGISIPGLSCFTKVRAAT